MFAALKNIFTSEAPTINNQPVDSQERKRVKHALRKTEYNAHEVSYEDMEAGYANAKGYRVPISKIQIRIEKPNKRTICACRTTVSPGKIYIQKINLSNSLIIFKSDTKNEYNCRIDIQESAGIEGTIARRAVREYERWPESAYRNVWNHNELEERFIRSYQTVEITLLFEDGTEKKYGKGSDISPGQFLEEYRQWLMDVCHTTFEFTPHYLNIIMNKTIANVGVKEEDVTGYFAGF